MASKDKALSRCPNGQSWDEQCIAQNKAISRNALAAVIVPETGASAGLLNNLLDRCSILLIPHPSSRNSVPPWLVPVDAYLAKRIHILFKTHASKTKLPLGQARMACPIDAPFDILVSKPGYHWDEPEWRA